MSNESELEAGAPRRKSRVGMWIAIGCGASLVLVGLCCGGGFLFGKLAFSRIAEELAASLQDNPVLREHIGDIEHMELDWRRTFATNGEEFVFHLRGPRGEGYLEIDKDELDGRIRHAKLELPSHEVLELFPEEEEEPPPPVPGAPAPGAPEPEPAPR